MRRHIANPKGQAMFGIVHGGMDFALRRSSLEYVSSLPFDGLAVGGSLGGSKADLKRLVEFLGPLLQAPATISKPVHLLGIGDAQNILSAVASGFDTFDSAFPTQIARHGRALVRSASGRRLAYLDLKKSKFESDFRPLDASCKCDVCRGGGEGTLSRAYLRHLYRAREPVLGTYMAHHNLATMFAFMSDIREAIFRNEI